MSALTWIPPNVYAGLQHSVHLPCPLITPNKVTFTLNAETVMLCVSLAESHGPALFRSMEQKSKPASPSAVRHGQVEDSLA